MLSAESTHEANFRWELDWHWNVQDSFPFGGNTEMSRRLQSYPLLHQVGQVSLYGDSWLYEGRFKPTGLQNLRTRTLTMVLLLHSTGQSKPQSYPRYNSRSNRLYLRMVGVAHARSERKNCWRPSLEATFHNSLSFQLGIGRRLGVGWSYLYFRQKGEGKKFIGDCVSYTRVKMTSLHWNFRVHVDQMLWRQHVEISIISASGPENSRITIT